MMMKPFLSGFISGLLSVIGCGTASIFPYRYYAIQIPDGCYQNGKLLGKTGNKGWPDLSLETCKPTSDNKLQCLLMKDEDFYAEKAEYLKCHKDLANCQRK